MTPKQKYVGRIIEACLNAAQSGPDKLATDSLVAELSAILDEVCEAIQEKAATVADLVAENFKEAAVLHPDQPNACYRSRAAGALAVAARLRRGGRTEEEFREEFTKWLRGLEDK